MKTMKHPRWTRADYELVARIMYETKLLFNTNEAATVLSLAVSKFANVFHDDNPAFDIEQFILACVTGKVK